MCETLIWPRLNASRSVFTLQKKKRYFHWCCLLGRFEHESPTATTYSHACSYSSPADLWPHKRSEPQVKHSADSSARAFAFITQHLSSPPTYNTALWANTSLAEPFEPQIPGRPALTQLRRNDSVLFAFPRFRGPVWWWWHPVTNISSQNWWMIHTPLHTLPFCFGPAESKPTIYCLMTYNFAFIVVLVPGFFKTSLKSHHWLQMLWNSSDP